MLATLGNHMKFSVAIILCPAFHVHGAAALQLDPVDLKEARHNDRVKVHWSTRNGCRMGQEDHEQERLFSSHRRMAQQWHRCDPKLDAHADEGINAVPDDWILADTPAACGGGKRGRLLIDGGDAGAGFGTEFFLYMINHILLAERRCLEPVILMTCAGAPLWFDPVSRQNPWEWYFEPLKVAQDTPRTTYKITLKQKETMHGSVSWAVHSGYYGCVHFESPEDFDEAWFRQMRIVGHRVVQQYFVVKPSILREVQELWDAHFSGATQVLGMHYRGGDKEGTYRAGFDNVTAYLDYATAFLEAYPGGRIMLATDDTKVEAEMLNGTWPAAVKNALAVPQNIMGDHHKAFDAHMSKSAVASRSRGKAVLLDILLLAKSDFLIYGQSTVVEAAFYVNSKLQTSSIPIWFQGRPKASKKWFLRHGGPRPRRNESGNR